MPALQQRLVQRRDALGSCAVVLADDHALHRAGLVDDAGPRNVRGDVTHAAHHGGITKRPPQDVVLDDTVLKRNNRRLGPTSGLTNVAAFSVSHNLTAMTTTSTTPSEGRIVGHGYARHVDVALRFVLNRETVLANRLQMLAAGDEGDVVTRVGEAAAVEAADTACSHERDLHVDRSC